MKCHLSNTKEDEIDIEKEWKNLQNILKSAANESLGTIKWRNRRKNLKIWDDQIKQWIEAKKKSFKKWLNSKKLEDKLEYKRNTALAKIEVRRRQRLSCDKFVTNLEYDTYRTQQKLYKILKRICKGLKNSTYWRKHRHKCIPSILWKVMEHNKHKWITIRIQLILLLTCFYNFWWTRKVVKINKKW